MLLQTNSYIVPKDKRAEHARLLRRFRAALAKLGCDSFEVYEQVGANWNTGEPTGRYVQIMRFRDRRHQQAVQQAERSDPVAQAIIAEFCQLINFPYQQQQGLFAVGFYNGVLPVAPTRPQADAGPDAGTAVQEPEHPTQIPPIADQFAAEQADADAGLGEVDHTAEERATSEAIADEGATETAVDSLDEAGDAGITGDDSADTVVAAADETQSDETQSDETQSDPAHSEQTQSDQLTPEDHAAPEGQADDLGALLDAHLDHLHPDNGQHTAHPLDHAADMPDEGQALDALDLDDLDLRDQRSSDPGRARNHVAR